MTENNKQQNEPHVESRILSIRDKKVILDADLAELYGVQTKVLNQAVKRNSAKFPSDFMFRLTAQELTALRSQTIDNKDEENNWSQTVTSSRKRRGVTYRPYAFTEHGTIMAANVLNSPKAVEMSVFIVRAFVKIREQLLANTTLEKRLTEVEKILLTHDSAIRELYDQIRPLLLPPKEPNKKAIGFHVKEKSVRYGKRKEESAK